MKILIFLACLAGFATCFIKHLNVPHALSGRINYTKDQLLKAKEYRQNHGFHYDVLLIDQMLATAQKNLDIISKLDEHITPTEASKYYIIVENFEVVSGALMNGNRHEMFKFYLTYRIAMDSIGLFSTPEMATKALGEIKKVIELENDFPMNSLEIEYAYTKLDSVTKKPVLQFDDFYAVANQTRAKINESIGRNNVGFAKMLIDQLTHYDNLTLSMAALFPLNSDMKIDNLFEISKLHVEERTKLENLTHVPSLRENLLARLNVQHFKLIQGIEAFEKRGDFYLAQVLASTNKRIYLIESNVKRLPNDADEKSASDLIDQIKNIETIVPVYLRNPAPRESLKAGSLYLAAMKHGLNFTEPPYPIQIKQFVKKIVDFEISLEEPFGVSSYDKIGAQAAQQYLSGLYDQLKTMISKSTIQSSSDDEKIALKSDEKIKQLIQLNRMEEAKEWRKELDTFTNATYELNKVLPIQNDEKIEMFYNGSIAHYALSQKLQQLIALR